MAVVLVAATRSACYSDDMLDQGKITSIDRALFAIRRFYNRTRGAYVLSWSHDRITILGYSIMSRQAIAALYSKQALANIRAGLQASEYKEVDQVLAIISTLPKPELPDGLFSDRQMIEHGIRLVWNRYYVFTVGTER